MSDALPSETTASLSQAPTVPGEAAGPGASGQGGPGLPPSLGQYRIVRLIGEGGMGAVYEAEQARPRRTVALKVIRQGFVTPQMLRRFELEAEVLGRLVHPGIAQIYEAGVLEASALWGAGGGAPAGAPVPYFAMEFIRGAPLTDYAAARRLGTRDRLELVARVCDAVQHAHQKGVIHRDLKPGNILVTDEGQPKVLDFGVARATDSDIQQTTARTNVGAILGTIPYMSPEQVSGDPAELDTRSDVYALGVVAYELLAGRMPYDLDRKMIHEAARIIREDEPTRLSTINRGLRGDVETIVVHALEKDKARRYGAASALAADIRRYLNDEPISARRASTWYQVAKFSRRNRVLVGGVGATIVALTCGVVGTGVALSREADQRRIAERSEREASEQRAIAEAEAARARDAVAAEKKRSAELNQVVEFQANMLAQIDPSEAGNRLRQGMEAGFGAAAATLSMPEAERARAADSFRAGLLRINLTDTAREFIDAAMLRPAVAAVDRQFADQPEVGATLRQVLAELYRKIGDSRTALALQTAATETWRRTRGNDSAVTLTGVSDLGVLNAELNRADEAETLLEEALEGRRRLLGEGHAQVVNTAVALANLWLVQARYDDAEALLVGTIERARGVTPPDEPNLIEAHAILGQVYASQGRLGDAERVCREVLEQFRRAPGAQPRDLLGSMVNLGNIVAALGRYPEAEPLLREGSEGMRRLYGEAHPQTLAALNSYAGIAFRLGRFEEAASSFRVTLDVLRAQLGDDHPQTLDAMNNLAVVLRNAERPAEAEPLCRAALEGRRRVLGEDHPSTLQSLSNLAVVLSSMGDHQAAERLYREVLERKRRVLGAAHPETLLAVHSLATELGFMSRFIEAEPLYREAYEARRAALGADHPDTIQSESNLAYLCESIGRYEESEALNGDACARAQRVLGENHPQTIRYRSNLATSKARVGKSAEAESILREVIERRRAVLGEDHPDTMHSVNVLGELCMTAGRSEEAERLFRECLERRTRVLGPEHEDTLESLNTLGAVRITRGEYADAERLLTEAVRLRTRVLGPRHVETLASVCNLANAIASQGRLAEAQELLEPAAETAIGTLPEGNQIRRTLIRMMGEICSRRDQAEPGKGYGAKAAEWKSRLPPVDEQGAGAPGVPRP